MTIAIAASPASARYGTNVTLSITGASASTAYTVTVGTTKVSRYDCITDGAGAATVLHPHAGAPGLMTFSLRPTAEYNGTTTAAATCTANGTT